MSRTVQLDTETAVLNTWSGKMQKPYVARVSGPDAQWVFKRSFLRPKMADGVVELPTREGVYEVRDFFEGEKRLRYFQVLDGFARELNTPSPEEVLDAAEISVPARSWHVLARVGVDDIPENDVASTLDVMTAIDEAEQTLKELGSVDLEDALMELDKIRRVAERL